MAGETPDSVKQFLLRWRTHAAAAWHASRSRAAAWRERQRGRKWPWAVGIVFGTLAALVLALVLIPGNAYRGIAGDYLSAKMNRPVRIVGDLHMHLFSTRPSVEVNGLEIDNPAWAAQWSKQARMANVQRLRVVAKLWPLLRGDLELPLLRIDNPTVVLLRDSMDRANWRFDPETPSKEATKLPPIERFLINNGVLTAVDQTRKLTFEGTVNSAEQGESGKSAFALVGQGRLNRAPFSAEVHGGPLLNVDENKPYQFTADVRAAATHVTAEGAVSHPFDFGGIVAALTVSGSDMADVYYLTGLTFPNTPPYRVSGKLTRDGNKYRLESMTGRVGDSDLAGWLAVDATNERPYLTADLKSRMLDFDDLGPLFGLPPSTGAGETASPEQKVEAVQAAVRANAPIPRVLPDAALQVERVRQMDADVTYAAETVKSRDFPLRHASVHVLLDHGVLKLSPVSFTFSRGKLTGIATINAQGPVPVSDVDMRFTDLRLEQFFPAAKGGEPMLEGMFEARARLHGTGDSIRKTAATASGQVTAVVPQGKIRKTIAELLGINVGSALIPLITGDESQTGLRCAIASFEAKNGVLHARRFVIDTDVVRARGEGVIDLKDEALNLELKGEPKKIELLRLIAPITIDGHLAKPRIGIEPGQAAVQGGIAAALATFAAPLAAILPFVNPGLAKDANCAALLTDAKARGAPVKQSQVKRHTIKEAQR